MAAEWSAAAVRSLRGGRAGSPAFCRGRRLAVYLWPLRPRSGACRGPSPATGRMHGALDLGGRPIGNCPVPAPCGGEPPLTWGHPGLPGVLVLTEGVEARLLLIGEHVVELLQRGPHRLHSVEHRLHALLHGIDAADGRQRHVSWARGLDDLRRLYRCVAELVEGRALLVGGIERLLNFIDRDAGDVARSSPQYSLYRPMTAWVVLPAVLPPGFATLPLGGAPCIAASRRRPPHSGARHSQVHH